MQISHMSLVYFASRFARTLFAGNQEGGGEGGLLWKKGRDKKHFFFNPFLFVASAPVS